MQGAANIAGRLGFETTALTLPIVIKVERGRAAGVDCRPILVGRSNPLVKPLLDRGAIDLKTLKPGQASWPS